MPTCPYCGKDTPQTGASYCSYCGSSLAQQTSTPSASRAQPSRSGYYTGESAPGLPDRYEKALKRVERMGTVVVILSVVVLALVLI